MSELAGAVQEFLKRYSPWRKGLMHPENYYCDMCGNREDLGHLATCAYIRMRDLSDSAGADRG